MLKHLATISFLSFVLVSSRVTLALAPVDLSAISDFRAFTHNIEGSSKENNLNLKFNELELAIQGYLNPYARGDVFVGAHGDGFEIEEAAATILRGLPLNLNVKAGRYLVDFGRLNQSHPHAWSFVDRPLSHRVLLGAEGLRDDGIQLSTLIPVGVYSRLSLNVLKGDGFAGGHAHHNEEESQAEGEHAVEGRNTEKPVFSGRLSMFLPLTEQANLDLALSGLDGIYLGKHEDEPDSKNLKATLGCFDFKYKYRPSDYRSLTLQGEIILNHREMEHEGGEVESITNYGGFVFVDYRFNKRYNLGFMIDFAPGIFDYSAEDIYEAGPEEGNNTPLGKFDEKNSTTALTAFIGFSLMEETTMIRLFGRYTKFSIDDPTLLATPELTSKKSQFLGGLQLVFSLGPHKPHEF